MKIRQTRRFKLVAFALAVAALGMAFGLGWHLGANGTDKKAYAAVWEAISTISEPEQCALCGNGEGMRYHAPCLVDLSTGEVGELTVYTPHRRLVGEIAPEEAQQTGTFNFFSCASLHGVRDTCNHTCQMTIPLEEMGMMNPGCFCRKCRELLAGAGIEGYILVDLYDIDHIKAYPVREGEVYTIRDYVVDVTCDHKNKEFDVDVRGLLYQD